MNNPHENCKLVVFSSKAWNAIVNETLRKDPVETGGILMGHILSNGYWIVMEVIPPGLNAIHQRSYFEYDSEFVNYMANSVSRQYKIELSVLGLWHRHPGSMDVFSGTDDGTNASFAQMNSYGAISGLVNIDPKLRFTLRHVAYPLQYQIVDVEVGDDLIPQQYFELRYSFGGELSHLAQTVNEENYNTRIAEPKRDGAYESSLVHSEKKEDNGCDKSVGREKKIKRLQFLIALVISFLLGFWIGCSKSSDGDKEKDEIQMSQTTDSVVRTIKVLPANQK